MRSAFGADATRVRAPRRLSAVVTGVFAGLLGAVAGAGTSAARPAALAGAFDRGVAAFRAGDYVQAEQTLRMVTEKASDNSTHKTAGSGFLNMDWALYLHAESAFFAGSVAAARSDFERVARLAHSRFADVAAFRAADCLWSSGAHADAAERYRRLLARIKVHPPSEIDVVVPRFRVALSAEERHLPRRPGCSWHSIATYRRTPWPRRRVGISPRRRLRRQRARNESESETRRRQLPPAPRRTSCIGRRP